VKNLFLLLVCRSSRHTTVSKNCRWHFCV